MPITAFCEDTTRMGVPHRTVVKLQEEGITSVDDLAEFRKETISEVAQNLRLPGGREPNPDPNTPQGSTSPVQPVAAELLRYYETVGRATTSQLQRPFQREMPRSTRRFKIITAAKPTATSSSPDITPSRERP
jgi:hypothetical protein